MDDFFGLLVIFFIYSAMSALGDKKKKKRRTGTRRRDMESAPDAGQMFKNMVDTFGKTQSQQRTAQQEPQARTQPQQAQIRQDAQRCDDAPGVHLHQTTQAQMSLAGEGEDPCHYGEAPETEAQDLPIDAQQRDEQSEAFRQDFLRGVIMSEILRRPCEKRAMYRNGRRA